MYTVRLQRYKGLENLSLWKKLCSFRQIFKSTYTTKTKEFEEDFYSSAK